MIIQTMIWFLHIISLQSRTKLTRRPVTQHYIVRTLFDIIYELDKVKQKAMKYILLFIFIADISRAFFPAFQSVLERIPNFSSNRLNYYVNNPFQGSISQQYYWEPRRVNRINYFN